jgi:hypothetical protein
MMKYFRHSEQIWAYALDGSQDALIPNDAIALTNEEIQALFARSIEPPNARRIGELRALLAASDFKVLPDYDEQNPAIVAQRQAWRNEIRSLLEQS